MKRLGILLLALAGLNALLGGCGGGEETGILALAFRLDGESPIVTAYIGDPDEDPFQPPAISLGAVEVEEGQVVAFPSSFEAAGGVADPERAQSLKTVATFLIDFELSELTFIEAITGDFTTEDPFDPAVEPDAASVQQLLSLYAEMADQEDALEAALSEIEERAVASAGTLYVRSPWAPAPGLLDVAKKSQEEARRLAQEHLQLLPQRNGRASAKAHPGDRRQDPRGQAAGSLQQAVVRQAGRRRQLRRLAGQSEDGRRFREDGRLTTSTTGWTK
ncbi:MAG: hypothetical protein AMJ77_06930 [Dehalococcoidia bacterium SM23_28_2]|nr:MAG: hypothetical protein AMJ77_06930 [Dehalococcoidia bacterium SM23_28_2]